MCHLGFVLSGAAVFRFGLFAAVVCDALSGVLPGAHRCFDVCWFSAVTSRQIVVVLVTIWMFLLFLFDFYSIFCSYLQWIFRKKYVGLRVQNLCVVYLLRMQVLGKYLSPRMNFACFSKILIPSTIGILVFTPYNMLPNCYINIVTTSFLSEDMLSWLSINYRKQDKSSPIG